MGQGHEDGGHTGSGHFGDGQCAGAAHHQVSPGIGIRHVLDKFTHLGLDPQPGIGGSHGLPVALAALVTHLDGHTGSCNRRRHLLVEDPGPQAATDHKQAQRIAAAAQLGIRQRHHLGAHRVAHHGGAGIGGEGTREGHQHPPGDTGQQLVGQAGGGILLVQQQRNAGQPGGHATRAGGEAPHAQHHIGLDGLEHLAGLQHGFDDTVGRREQTLDAVATHPLDVDEGDGITMGRHQLRLHPVGSAEPVDGPALGLEAIGDGQAGEHMPPGTTRHHQ